MRRFGSHALRLDVHHVRGMAQDFFCQSLDILAHFLVILEDERNGAHEPRAAANASAAVQPDRRFADRLSGGSGRPAGCRADAAAARNPRRPRTGRTSCSRRLVSQLSAAQKQRANELGQWKQANPHLARNCRMAAEALGKVQTEFLESLTAEVTANYENLLDGEFMLNEFVDRFGPRMAHLNGLLQVLSQLSATPNPTGTPNTP